LEIALAVSDACYRFRLLLRSQPLSRDRVYSIDRRKPQ
jgi:hypothetical protein